MTRPRPGCRLCSLLLSGLFLLPFRAAGETEIGGLKVSGEAEVGERILMDRPSKAERAKFEEYRDFPPGIFLEGLRLGVESPDEAYSFELQAREAGEDDQSFLLRGSNLGRYLFEFKWDQIPHVFSRSGRSPFIETSRGVFELPDSLQGAVQAAPTTAAKSTLLQNALATAPGIDLETRWDSASILLRFTPTPEWSLQGEYTRTRKEGERPIGTTFVFTNQVELPEPIDQTVHDLTVTAELAKERWQLQFTSNLSIFENDVDVLVWDNPLRLTDDATLGSSRGRLDLAPDNFALAFSLTGGLNLPWRSRLTGTFSYGLRFQDDNFIPHTINSAISHPGLALPASSLDGEVHTRLANIRFTTHPLRHISMGAYYRFYDFDDKSPNFTFPARVRTDTSLITDPVTSSRFSYTKHNAGADATWRPLSPLALKLSFDWERWDRDDRHREAPESDEYTPKVAVDYTPADWLLLRASYAHSQRRISAYNTFVHLAHTVAPEEFEEEVPQAQSVLLRKYDEADRDRDRVDLLAQITPIDTLTFTPTVSFRDDNYKNSILGLQDDESWAVGFDLGWSLTDRLALSTYYMREWINARQRSRYREPPAQLENPTFDWVAENDDTIDTVGVGINAVLIPQRLDLRLAYNFSKAKGEMEAFNPVTPTGDTPAQNVAATAVDFPDIEDRLHQIEVSLRYRITPAAYVRLRYLYENFDITDFRIEDIQPFMGAVDPASATSIFLGAQIRDYTAHVFALTFGYRF